MKQKADYMINNMATQNDGHAASVMRHATMAPHNAFGRLFLTLLMMLLTATTA